MNVNRNSIEAVTALRSSLRVVCPAWPKMYDEVPVRVIRTGPAQNGVKMGRWVDHQTQKFSAGELWETLTYAVLWFCGLICIAICFR